MKEKRFGRSPEGPGTDRLQRSQENEGKMETDRGGGDSAAGAHTRCISAQ